MDEAFLSAVPTRFTEMFEISLRARVVWAELTCDNNAGSVPWSEGQADYLVEDLGPDRCRFTWTIAFDPRLLG